MVTVWHSFCSFILTVTWTFYILLLTLPLSDSQKIISRESFAVFQERFECERWHEWWQHNNAWLAQYGVTVTQCEEVKGKHAIDFETASQFRQ